MAPATVAALAAWVLFAPGAFAAAPEGPWLGLNGNSSGFVGPLDEFLEHGFLYDRSGPLVFEAGATLAKSGAGLEKSIKAGMMPVVLIQFAGAETCTFGKPCLPTDQKALTRYARGFVSTAEEIADKYPAAGIKFEAINEPWGFGTAEQYAAFLALLLPAVRSSHVPLSDVYVGATGLGWVSGLYQAQPQLRDEIQAWYLHPYGKARKPGEGISELPAIRAEMAAGADNLIISEIGYCAVSIRSEQCLTSSASASDEKDAAQALQRELVTAVGYHQAGWLKALLVYSRSDGGWAAELPHGELTETGRMLEGFGDRYG